MNSRIDPGLPAAATAASAGPALRPPALLAGDTGWPLPAHWRAVDVLSDLHLAEALPVTLAAFERCLLGGPADAVFLLGDVFEVWVGDDAASRPFEARCVALLREATRRRPVWLLPGNRDFLLGDEFHAATGVQRLADPATVHGFGQTVVFSHGDALVLDDHKYQAFRAKVRTAAWQQAFLAQPLDTRLAIAAQMRAASEASHGAPETYADADPALAGRWLAQTGARVLVHGHTHRPASEQRAEGWTRHVLSDWDLDHAQPGRAEVMRWTARGFERLSPEAAVQASALR